ncbi:hypothetical protein [Paenibacillus camerounensis]|uniref:hypothetical protein n=1 Tax=Paenibacillus camerounensis TaxID=1243663 RepID=UPI0005AA46D3|nr:hypothetical protein [Paenibacillus camerounensis]
MDIILYTENQRNKLLTLLTNLRENNKYFNKTFKSMSEFSHENIMDVYDFIEPITKQNIMSNIHQYLPSSFVSNFKSHDELERELLNVDNLSQNHDKVYSSQNEKWFIETTTGTTGKPFAVVKTMRERMIEASYLLKCRKRVYEDVSLKNGFLLIHQLDPYLKSIDFRKNDENLQHVVKYMLETKPEWMFITAYLLKRLSNYLLINKPMDLSGLNLKFIENTSQHLLPEELETIEALFQTKIINNYGCREFWNIGYECKEAGHLHLNSDYLIVDVIDDEGKIIKEEGIVGDVVVTNLVNKTMPFIKYYLGDRAKIYNNCTCGIKTPYIVLEEGRKHEKLVNTKYYGNVVFRKVLRGLYFHNKYHELKRIKIIQDEPFHLSVYLDINGNSIEGFKEKFLWHCNETIGKDIQAFSIDFVYDYPFQESNSYKDQVFINKVI